MVRGEGLDGPVSNEVEPAVSDVSNGEYALIQQRCDDSGAHSGIVRSAPGLAIHDCVCSSDCAGQPIGWCRDRGIVGADQRKICLSGCFSEVGLNCLYCKGTGHLAGVASAHSITDDIESKRRIRDKPILVVRPLEPGIGFGAMQSFQRQTIPPSGRKTLQAGAELAGEFIRTAVAMRQFFL